MEDFDRSLKDIGDSVRERLTRKYYAREKVLQASRETIKHCADAIRAVHRAEFEKARTLLESAKALIVQTKKELADYPDLLHVGFVDDAQKEYAEGMITLALVAGEHLPDPEVLEVEDAPYLNGMGEAIGELRRYVLDALRRDEVGRCEEVLDAMDGMYGILITIDFPDALTGGLRRTTDNARGILERTRGDLTLAVRQRSLEKKLGDFQGNIR